jgi:uncharacterized membrane protein YkoI
MITPEQAISIAKKQALAHGWALVEPLLIIERKRWFGGLSRYEINSDPSMRGSRAHFVIDATSGEIISKGYVSR